MSEENVEFARRVYAAMQRMLTTREVDRALVEELWTEDCVLRPAGILPRRRRRLRRSGWGVS